MTYKIKDWDAHFEKSDTRKCKEMKWIPVPTDTTDKKYRRITKMKDGPEIFGIWISLLEIASKMPVRGTLSDKDGDLTFEDMELIGGFPALTYKKVLERLSGEEIGWVEEEKCQNSEEKAISGSHPEESGNHPDDIPTNREIIPTTRQDKTIQDITGQDNIKHLFEDFRKAYPGNKKGFDFEFDNFKSKHKNWKELVALLVPALRREVEHKESLKLAGAFCPSWKNLTTWINQKCWEQEFGEIVVQAKPQVLSFRERDELALKESLAKTERMLHASKLREFRPREDGYLSQGNRNDVDSQEPLYLGGPLGQEM